MIALAIGVALLLQGSNARGLAGDAASGFSLGALRHFHEADAAVQSKDLGLAETAIEVAAALGGAKAIPLRDFYEGTIAYLRGEAALALAMRVESGIPEWDLTVMQFERAWESFASAAQSDSGWDEARRNAERAARQLLSATDQRKLAIDAKKKASANAPPPKPDDTQPKPDDKKTSQIEPDEDVTVTATRLLNEQIDELWEKLTEKEFQKRDARRRARQVDTLSGGRGW
jgi:hypothetical protein